VVTDKGPQPKVLARIAKTHVVGQKHPNQQIDATTISYMLVCESWTNSRLK